MEPCTDAERRALAGNPDEPVVLERHELDALLGTVDYHPSLGDPVSATHYRRSLPDGSCLHLVIEPGAATLHRDRYDPHGGPGLLAAHLMDESPTQALSVVVAAIGLLRRIAG